MRGSRVIGVAKTSMFINRGYVAVKGSMGYSVLCCASRAFQQLLFHATMDLIKYSLQIAGGFDCSLEGPVECFNAPSGQYAHKYISVIV